MNTQNVFRVMVWIGLTSLASLSLAAEGVWTRRADMPTARSGCSTSVVDGKIYAIGGGRSMTGPYLSTMEAYDPATDSWAPKANMPTARNGHAAAVLNDKIYAIGGEPSAQASIPTVEEYDPATDTWTRRADMPTRRTFLCAAAVNRKIYAIGGVIAGAPAVPDKDTHAVEEYDPATNRWTRRADIPTQRSGAGAAVVDGKIYVMGGVPGDLENASVSTVEVYDPATDTWTRKDNMTTAKSFLSLCVAGGKIYAIGGGTFGAAPFSAVEEYDPAAGVWTTKPSMPTARFGVSASLVNDRIYAIGGARDWYPAAGMPTVEEYDPNPLVVDFNGDGIVDIKDLLQMIESWNQADLTVDIGPRPFGDGIVDEKDLEVLMSHWGEEPGLIAKWKLDEAEGMTASDSAGTSDGVLAGNPAWQPTDGKVGGALRLNGVGDCVMTKFVCDPSEGPFSVFAWVKGGAPGQVIVSQQGGANWLVGSSPEGTLMTDLKSSGRQSKPLASAALVTDDRWHHVGLSWDGETRILYIDEVEVVKDTQVNLAGSAGNVTIGAGSTLAPGTFWSGLIDDVRIYNRAVKP